MVLDSEDILVFMYTYYGAQVLKDKMKKVRLFIKETYGEEVQ